VAQQEDAKLGTPDDRPATSSSQRTKFGGVVLLLRDLNALPWKTWTADWPQPFETVSAETCLKWLTLAACSGKANAAALLGDDVCRDLFGIPRVLPVADVARWLRAVGEEQTQIFSASAAADGLTRREMRWLGFPRNTGISRKWCTALSSVAWLVYRGFTRRLPGFANSSADYLWRNFLDIDAVVECEQNRVVVRCGRAPLHLVLSLTGMTRGLVASTDHRGRPIQVFSQA